MVEAQKGKGKRRSDKKIFEQDQKLAENGSFVIQEEKRNICVWKKLRV